MSGGELVVETRQVDEVTLLYPRGFINAHTVRVFEDEIRRALAEGRCKLVVNASALNYIASAGLGAMMGAIEEIRGRGGDLRLAGLSDSVKNILELLGFHHLYRIFPTEIEAIRSYVDAGGAR
jgi:anti-sigma B factor antagonist